MHIDDPPDLELHPTQGPPAPAMRPPVRSTGLLIAVGALAIAAGAAAYFAFAWRPHAPTAVVAQTAPAATPTRPPAPLGGTGESIPLPPLDASDTLVRTLVQALSESPAVMAWLPTKGLIRNFTLVVTNIADGATPAKQLKVLRPSGSFRTVEGNGQRFVDPRSYARYARIAEAVQSIDPAGAARLYATLKPRIEEAYRDLGAPDGSFDRTLERAFVALLATPVVTDAIRLKPKGIGYAYADDRLESLTAAQKQLLRMGPGNVRIVEAKLREIARALGIPSSRLPAA